MKLGSSAKPKRVVPCPYCRSGMTEIREHFYCGQCGWNARNLRSDVASSWVVSLAAVIVWWAWGYFAVHAPWWFLSLGLIFVMWSVGEAIYLRIIVPDLAPPAPKLFTARVPPRLMKADLRVMDLFDLIIGLLFIGVGSSFATERVGCWETLQHWKTATLTRLGECLVPWFFPAIGALVVVNHFFQRHREARLAKVGTITTGLVTSVSRGKRGKTVGYEFSDSQGVLFRGSSTPQDEVSFEEGNEIFVVFDPNKPKTNQALPGMRFYRPEGEVLSGK